MRLYILLVAAASIAALCVGQGCPTGANPAPSPAPGTSDTGAPSTADDGPDSPQDNAPPQHDLTGPWEDNGRVVRIAQSGDQVTALYAEPYVCDHRDGTGETDQTDLDFNATISGDQLTGDTSVCGYGKDNPAGVGIRSAQITLTVNSDDTTLTGSWHNDQDDSDVPISLTRLGCLEKSATDYGLPAGNIQTSEYNANRVRRNDGSVETVADDYVLNPQTDDWVRRHRGVDYSSRDAQGNVTNVPFTAGVTGTAGVVAGSQWNTINVTLPNGNIVQYLHASEIDVTDHAPVGPNTVLGRTGDTGADAIHLHVQAKDSSGNYINPACAEEGIVQ